MESEDEDAFRRDALAMFAEIDGEEGNGSCSPKPSNCAQSQTLVPLLEVAQTAPHTQAVAPHTQAVTLKIPDPLQLHSTALHVAGERQAKLNTLIAQNEKVCGP